MLAVQLGDFRLDFRDLCVAVSQVVAARVPSPQMLSEPPLQSGARSHVWPSPSGCCRPGLASPVRERCVSGPDGGHSSRSGFFHAAWRFGAFHGVEWCSTACCHVLCWGMCVASVCGPCVSEPQGFTRALTPCASVHLWPAQIRVWILVLSTLRACSARHQHTPPCSQPPRWLRGGLPSSQVIWDL